RSWAGPQLLPLPISERPPPSPLLRLAPVAAQEIEQYLKILLLLLPMGEMGAVLEHGHLRIGQRLVHAHGAGRGKLVMRADGDQAWLGDPVHVGDAVPVLEVARIEELVRP